MRRNAWAFFPVILFLTFGIIGCTTSYPLGLRAQEWDSLSPARQAELTAVQAKIEQYKSDEARCRDIAEMKMKTQVPVGGFSSSEGLDVAMGVNQELYKDCLRRAGWTEETLQPILYWMNYAEHIE